MAGLKREILFDEIKRDVNDDKSGIFLLKERIDEANACGQQEDKKIKYKAYVSPNRKPALDIMLPCGVSFTVEDNRISVSDFGLTSAQIKELRQFFYMNGIENFSLPNEEDREFAEKLQQAEDELAAEPQRFAVGDRRDIPPVPSNDNESDSIARMSEEEILSYKKAMVDNAKSLSKNEFIKKDVSEKAPKKKVYPSVEAIYEAFQSHVGNTKKEMSENYRINSYGNGYELIFFTDADQKRLGAEKDKKGNVKSNYQFALRGEIFKDENGQNKLNITFMTPKYGKMDDWMFDEVMNLADSNKITHMKYNGGLQHKTAFFNACAKKLIVPTGIKLKKKDVEEMISIAKKNNDKTSARKDFYLRLAAQLEENMQNEGSYADGGHPFHEIIKNLRDDAKNEGVIAESKLKYKKFNQFYENNIMGRVLPDNSKETKPKSDAVRELAAGRAYIDFLTEYRDNNEFQYHSDEQKKAFYEKCYNEHVYNYDGELKEELKGTNPTNPKDRKLRKELTDKKYTEVIDEINSLTTNLKYDLGVDVDYPRLSKRDYMGDREDILNPNLGRIAKWQQVLDDRARAQRNSHTSTNSLPVGHAGR